MPQRHLDRLTAVDAGFLHQEGPSSHMNIGGATVFEGPPPTLDELLEQVRQRLHLVPRYRHRLARTRIDSGRPTWVDDPAFNLEYHVRHTALPSPGNWEQLCLLTARIFSQRLDRSKPLWEMWLVEGLEDGGFALISKNHHALVDGVAGIDLVTVLFDLQRTPAVIEHSGRPWQPHPEPGALDLMTAGARGALRTGVEIANEALEAAAHPERALATARAVAEGLGEVVWAALNPAPPTPLNVEIGPHRRFVGVGCRLDDFKLVKDAFGGTVNDVVLSVVTGALRAFLIARGVRTQGLELRALVPVSIRGRDDRGQLGNRLAVIRGPVPVYIEDPLQRLTFIRRAMDGLKDSKQALGAEVIASAQNFAPPTILAQASRLNFSTRLYNLLVTNLPGPQFPLYVLGRELLHAYPVAFLPKRHALAVAIMSYNGEMNFGLLGDYDAMPDLEALGDGIAAGLSELAGLARAAAPERVTERDAARNGTPARAPRRAPQPNPHAPQPTRPGMQ
jgi:WS/DGAT/MGAT family acyltransferase